MVTDKAAIWNEKQPRQLIEVLAGIGPKEAMQKFLRDVMTEKEIIEISARLEAARMLAGGATYAEITKTTKLSSRTVARISDWIQNGCGGYGAALETLSAHHTHMSPARTE